MPKVKKVKRALHKKVKKAQPTPTSAEPELGAGLDMGRHLAMLTDMDTFSMNPDDAMITVEVKIGDRKFKQAMDEVYAWKWDNARKRFSKEELAKHISRCAFYSATFLVAATEAAAEYEKVENFFTLWRNEEASKAEERIKLQRIKEMGAIESGPNKRPKLRTQVGQITKDQIDAEITAVDPDADEDDPDARKKRFLGWLENLRVAKKNRDMMRGLYQITQNAGSYLQTLTKMYNVEDAAGRM